MKVFFGFFFKIWPCVRVFTNRGVASLNLHFQAFLLLQKKVVLCLFGLQILVVLGLLHLDVVKLEWEEQTW